MTLTLDITDAVLFKTLGDFLTAILPQGTEIVQGQGDRVPPPTSPDYVVMTSLFLDRLATNIDTTPDVAEDDPPPTTKVVKSSYQWTVQLDTHGEQAHNNALIISTMFRDEFACSQIAASGYEIQPLYADQPRQVPFISESVQYEDRWTLEAHLQFNPTLAPPQQYADTLKVQLINVEAMIFGQEN